MILVLATRSAGKLRELREILGDLPVELKTLADYPQVGEIAETGTSFEQNATIKGVAVAKATRQWAMGEDSGLVVDALGGRPGVFSARYAGEPTNDAANTAKLLRDVEGVENRRARYVCCAVLVSPDGVKRAVATGTCEGEIIDTPRGSGGFGYDPVFLVPARGLTMAELPADVKNAISHRGRAMAEMRAHVATLMRA